MGRAIITAADVAEARRAEAAREPAEAVAAKREPIAAPPQKDEYLDRLVKYVPAEVVAAYLGVQAGVGGLPAAQQPLGAWALFLFFLLATGFWLRKQGVLRRTQLLVSMAAFAVWALAAGGGPLAVDAAGRELARAWGPIVVPCFTFAAALVEPRK